MTTTVKQLREWLKQFDDDVEVQVIVNSNLYDVHKFEDMKDKTLED